MAQQEGPWGCKAGPGLTGGQRRLLWIAVALAGVVAIWKLAEAYPDALQSDWDKVRLINLVAFITLLSSSIVLGRRFRARETLRNIAIWCALFAALGLGYTFSGELAGIGDRVRGELFRARRSQRRRGRCRSPRAKMAAITWTAPSTARRPVLRSIRARAILS